MESQSSGPEILAAIIKEFLLNSKCATEDQQKAYLLELLGNKKLVTTLLYRGSEHGWTAADFHSRCDNKGPTVSLFKVRDGDCIGGYTKAQWSSSDPDGQFVRDSDAMLFNLAAVTSLLNKQDRGRYGAEMIVDLGFLVKVQVTQVHLMDLLMLKVDAIHKQMNLVMVSQLMLMETICSLTKRKGLEHSQ